MAKDSEAGVRRRRGAPEDAGARGAGGDSRLVRTLATGMALLALFDAEHRRWSLDEMVVGSGVSRMTAYRMARTLQDTGHLVHDPAIGGYRLGPAMLAGIYLAEGFAPLVDVARPYLESLMKETGELAAIAVELDGYAVCADLVASARPFVPEIAVGRVIGDTANAHGKMFAAMKSDVESAHASPRSLTGASRHRRSPIPPGLLQSWRRSAARGWHWTSRSTTSARARWSLRCATRPRSSSRRWASWCRRAALVPRHERPAPPRRATVASLSEFCGYARSESARSDRATGTGRLTGRAPSCTHPYGATVKVRRDATRKRPPFCRRTRPAVDSRLPADDRRQSHRDGGRGLPTPTEAGYVRRFETASTARPRLRWFDRPPVAKWPCQYMILQYHNCTLAREPGVRHSLTERERHDRRRALEAELHGAVVA